MSEPIGNRCPKCGGETTFGYGLAGGGIGSYEMCMEDDCDYFKKEPQRREEDDEPEETE